MKVRAIVVLIGLVAASCALVVGGASPAGAETIDVTTTEDVVAPLDGQTSLREAVITINTSGDADAQIDLVDQLTYQLTICGAGDENGSASGDLDLLDAERVQIVGDAVVEQTCPDQRVVDSQSAAGTLALYRTILTGGDSTGNGGGAEVAGDLVLALGAELRGNEAAGSGGGAWVGGTAEVQQSRVRDNVAGGAGGGIRAASTTRFYRSAVQGNVAGGDGGGFTTSGNARIQTSTVTQNRSATGGGGASASGYIAVNTATVYANRAPDASNLEAGDDIRAVSSVIALGSGGEDCGATNGFDSDGYNVGMDASCDPTVAADEPGVHPMLAGVDPDFFGGFSQGRPPTVGSPVLDLDPNPCVGQPDDQRFEDRPSVVGGSCDSGSLERTPQPCTASGFPDVGNGSEFADDVCWLAQMDITGGYPDGGFHPSDPVTRQSMSAFIFRLAGSPPFPAPAAPVFSDVGVTHPFATEIGWMVVQEIAEGYGDGSFKGGAPVSRQAMSAFLFRVAGEPAFVPPSPTFPDVPDDHPFFAEVEWLAATDITGGYGDGTFKPANPVSRQAMAAFLQRLALDVAPAGL